MKIYTKESLINELRDIRQRGWILSGRHGNDGAVGNTLEDLLGIEENNLPIREPVSSQARFNDGEHATLVKRS